MLASTYNQQARVILCGVLALLVIPAFSTSNNLSDKEQKADTIDLQSAEKHSSPFAPVTTLSKKLGTGDIQSGKGGASPAGYRIFGIVSAQEKNVAILQLPDESFHIIEQGEVFNELVVISINKRRVVLQTPLGNFQLFVSE